MEQQRISEFLIRHGVQPDALDVPKVIDSCLRQMEWGLTGRPSCLAMIPTYLGGPRTCGEEEPVIVMDVGGTNTRVALVRLTLDGRPIIDYFQRHRTPGTDAPMDSAEFFRHLAEYLTPVAAKSRRIAICFSYASRPLPDHDAVVVAGGKQLQVPDIVGQTIGASLNRELAALGLPQIPKLVVTNDTVSVLLGGMAVSDPTQYSGYLGLVLGTGLNLCHQEPQESPCPGAIVNQECGGYLEFLLGDIDRAYIASTIDPEIDWCEKVVSGRYFGEITAATAAVAAGEGLLSRAFGDALAKLGPVTTAALSEFLADPAGENPLARCCDGPEDRAALMALTDGLEDRAAQFVSLCLTASLIRGQCGDDAGRPAYITVDGSMYHKLPGFRQKIDRRMAAMAAGRYGKHYEFHSVENAPLIGTTFAGLLI